MEYLRPHPPEPRPTAWQTQADASDEATESREAATTSETSIRPILLSSIGDLCKLRLHDLIENAVTSAQHYWISAMAGRGVSQRLAARPALHEDRGAPSRSDASGSRQWIEMAARFTRRRDARLASRRLIIARPPEIAV